jgi:vacuolar-type H+-ATPase subunit F/Vma7
MSRIVALGEDDRLAGFALAGAAVIEAATDAEIRRAWDELDADVGFVIMSARASQTLGSVLGDRADVLTAVLP